MVVLSEVKAISFIFLFFDYIYIWSSHVKINYPRYIIGPALVTTKDAGDAITLLQSLAGSTFDSSQLVLTACMGYPNVNESRLEALRNKHRPSVLAAIQERSSGLRSLTDSQSLASKLYIFKHDAVSLISGTKKTDAADERTDGDINHTSSSLSNSDDLSSNVSGVTELDSVPDIQEQVNFQFCVSPSQSFYITCHFLLVLSYLYCMHKSLV